jgi:cysteine synthase A
MSEHNRVFIGGAFVAGVLVTIALKELHRQQFGTAPTNQTMQSNLSSHEEDLLNSVRSGPPAIVEGVEGCIGNTPLFRIKSLSDETGCEILAKAEVRGLQILPCAYDSSSDRYAVPQWSRRQPQGSCGVKHD